MKSSGKQAERNEQQPLIDEFNDFVLLIAPEPPTPWTNEARIAYNKLARRLEKVS